MKQTPFLLTAALMGASAHATLINLDSNASNTTNDSGHPTMNIVQNPQWAPALPGSYWISNGYTGDPKSEGYTVYPNGTQVTFTQTFTLDGPVMAASLSVMADDTTSVIVNHYTIYAAANPPGGYPTCSSSTIGCLSSTMKTFSTADLVPYLNTGVNSISFDVSQRAKVSFGLDYAGSITTAASVPEPTSLALIGFGLIGLGASQYRRRRKHNS